MQLNAQMKKKTTPKQFISLFQADLKSDLSLVRVNKEILLRVLNRLLEFYPNLGLFIPVGFALSLV